MKIWRVAVGVSILSASALATTVSGYDFGFSGSGVGLQQLILNGGTITLNATDSGWWDNTGFNDNTNTNYIAGFCGVCTNPYFNNFFVFSLGTVSVPITSATLSIFNPSSGYSSPLPTEIYRVGSVSTPIATLTGGGTAQVGIFNDLASGTVYGTTLVSAATDNAQVTIPLDSAAVAALNKAGGGYIAFGGTLIDAVPEPSTFGLAGVGAIVLMWLARGRTQISKDSRSRAQI
jgi:PEP-CTERM motif